MSSPRNEMNFSDEYDRFQPIYIRNERRAEPPFDNSYFMSVGHGIGSGLLATAQMVLHPFDTMIYPAYRILNDLHLASANRFDAAPASTMAFVVDYSLAKTVITSCPDIAVDAEQRIQDRIDMFNIFVDTFQHASGPRRAGIVAHYVTQAASSAGVFGATINGIKMAANFHTMRVAFNPPSFHNRVGDKPTLMAFDNLDVTFIRATNEYKSILYAITEDQKLIIAHSLQRGNPSGLIGFPETVSFKHHDINGGRPVYTSGSGYYDKGKIKHLDNGSGHYLPYGAHLKKLTERVFVRNGFTEAQGLYKDIYIAAGARMNEAVRTTNKMRFFNSNRIVAGVGTTLATAFDSDYHAEILIDQSLNSSKLHSYDFVAHTLDENDITTTEKTPMFIRTSLEQEQDEDLLQEKLPQAAVELLLDDDAKKKVYYADLRQKAAAARQAQSEFAVLVEEHKKTGSAITPQVRTRLREIAQPLQEFGVLGCQIATLATMAGGHARTFRGVSKVSEGLLSLGMGLSSLAAAKSLMSLTAATGMVGAAIGVMSIAVGLFGNDDADGMPSELGVVIEMMQAMHRDLLQVAKQLEQLGENMAVAIHRLNQVNAKLDRLERMHSISMKELHTKDLIDIADALKKEMMGEFTLSDAKKMKYIQRLSTWLDHHSHAQIQTSILRDSTEVAKCVEILSSDDFDMAALFPLFVTQLMRLAPDNLFQDVKIEELPNIAVLMSVCEIYTGAINHYQFNENYSPSLERAKAKLQQVLKMIDDIRNNEELLEVLFSQYAEARYQVGRCLEKCRTEFSVTPGVALQNHLKTSTATENLMFTLDQLELRRIILVRIAELCEFKDEKLEQVMNLESKKDILSLPADVFAAEDSKLFSAAGKSDFVAVKRILELGAAVNAWDGPRTRSYHGCNTGTFGQAVHHLARDRNTVVHYSQTPNILHLLCKAANFEMNNGSWDSYGTWGANIRPIQWMLNCGHFDLAILLCANGYDISEAEGWPTDLGNAYQWARNGDTNCIIQIDLVKEMNQESSLINKKSLRKAYGFYKAIEAGLHVPTEDISQACVLLLVAILGDLRPLRALGKLTIDINKPLTKSGFTFLMLAVWCGKENVVKVLLDQGADVKMKGKFLPNESYQVLHFAREKKYDAVTAILIEKIRGKLSSSKFLRGVKARNPAPLVTKKAIAPRMSTSKPISELINAVIVRLNFTISTLSAVKESNSQSKEDAKNTPPQSTDKQTKIKALLQRANKIYKLLEKYCLTLPAKEDDLGEMEKAIAKANACLNKNDNDDDADDKVDNINITPKLIDALEEIISVTNMLDASLKLNDSYKLSDNVAILLKEIATMIAAIKESKRSTPVVSRPDSPLQQGSMFKHGVIPGALPQAAKKFAI